jgi:hypothetical protein
VDGPLEVGNDKKMAQEWLPPLFTPEPYLQTGCGIHTFRIRIDLWLAGRTAGVGGKVWSDTIDWKNGKGPQKSGVNLGFSYDWLKC